jgi:glycosyltransferase involved in cell wall biosynthesis
MTGLRILFVTHAYPRFATDAAGSFLHRLAVALRAGGCDVRVLAPSGVGLARAQEIDGVPIQRFRYAPRRMESLAYTGTMAEQVLGSLRGKGALAGMLTTGSLAVRRAVREFAPVLVHAHWWFPSGLLAVVGAGNTPLVTTLHGSDVRLARRLPLVHPLFRRTMARSAAATAVSSWLAGEARAMAPDARISVAPMPADIALFTAELTERVPGRFLFVGRLNAQKGVGDLIDALAWAAPHVTLDVVGDGDHAETAALRARADRAGIASRIHWRGAVPRDALPALYRRAQALVVPSRNEGLGLVAVEAQLCQTPVIAYRSGGLPDVVRPDWGGTLVTPGDTRELAAALTAADARGAAVDGLGSTARAQMLDRFAPGAVAARYRELYRAVLAGADAEAGTHAG